jgi:Cof subfamily protein (haloacid dehalogenase superfamily)
MVTSRRIAFLDVDGTLVDHHQQLAESAIAAVRGARAAGHLVYVCTGRGRREIPDSVLRIGFDGAITAGGGFVEQGDELVASYTMPEADVARVRSFFEAADIEFILQGYDDIWASPGLLARVRPLFEGEIARGRDATATADMEKLAARMAPRPRPAGEPVAKATFFGSDPGAFARVRDGLGERFHVITGTIPYLGESGGEVSLAGMTKGAAIVEHVGRVGLTLADAIGIGDSVNDLEMLQVCGLGIAMGNAPDQVKEVADEVTSGVDADGVWNAFVRHGLVTA